MFSAVMKYACLISFFITITSANPSEISVGGLGNAGNTGVCTEGSAKLLLEEIISYDKEETNLYVGFLGAMELIKIGSFPKYYISTAAVSSDLTYAITYGSFSGAADIRGDRWALRVYRLDGTAGPQDLIAEKRYSTDSCSMVYNSAENIFYIAITTPSTAGNPSMDDYFRAYGRTGETTLLKFSVEVGRIELITEYQYRLNLLDFRESDKAIIIEAFEFPYCKSIGTITNDGRDLYLGRIIPAGFEQLFHDTIQEGVVPIAYYTVPDYNVLSSYGVFIAYRDYRELSDLMKPNADIREGVFELGWGIHMPLIYLPKTDSVFFVREEEGVYHVSGKDLNEIDKTYRNYDDYFELSNTDRAQWFLEREIR